MDKYNTQEKAYEYAIMAWPISDQSSHPAPFYNFVKKIILTNLKEITDEKLFCAEVGFGSGKILFDIHTSKSCKKIIGIEQSQAMFEITKSLLLKKSPVKIGMTTISGLGLKNILLRIGDIQSLDLKIESYGFVVCINVLDRIPNTKRGIFEICRILKKEGVLIVATAFDYKKPTTPLEQRLNHSQIVEEFKKNNCFVTKKYKTSLAKKVGKKLIRYNEHIFVLKKLSKKPL